MDGMKEGIPMTEIDDFYNDARRYDLESSKISGDVPFYEECIERYGEPVLEIACGTGRVTIPLAESGFDVTGVDLIETMLEEAKRKAAVKNVDIEWVRADARNFDLGRKFRTIFIPFNSIAHFKTRKDIEGLFRSVKNHLSEGGRFIIDYFNPDLKILTREPSGRYLNTEFTDDEGCRVEITENNLYDTADQINRIKWYYRIEGEEEFSVDLNMRIFFPAELDDLLHYNGFSVEAKYGDYEKTPFSTESSKQILICRIP